jgi:hypothetical protein
VNEKPTKAELASYLDYARKIASTLHGARAVVSQNVGLPWLKEFPQLAFGYGSGELGEDAIMYQVISSGTDQLVWKDGTGFEIIHAKEEGA